ncbi:hypothetical protein GTJ59_16855 [Enterobacter hormaechei]|uniref:hypothetical protein n=1 Tax=Enterobacter hormaechei TaxID=158836 RepID=UPI00136DB083|nr:hypothetical protein [Enterobacter hormaechei]EMA0457719.1 hypothetical protein [Enterobacter hormaechei subsp. hoffmannii]MXR82602.1 hypothetical protein [Enterobacter hormaechei]MXR87106.1 hypothetical protein [Enterobacter hormaechei]
MSDKYFVAFKLVGNNPRTGDVGSIVTEDLPGQDPDVVFKAMKKLLCDKIPCPEDELVITAFNKL